MVGRSCIMPLVKLIFPSLTEQLRKAAQNNGAYTREEGGAGPYVNPHISVILLCLLIISPFNLLSLCSPIEVLLQCHSHAFHFRCEAKAPFSRRGSQRGADRALGWQCNGGGRRFVFDSGKKGQAFRSR